MNRIYVLILSSFVLISIAGCAEGDITSDQDSANNVRPEILPDAGNNQNSDAGGTPDTGDDPDTGDGPDADGGPTCIPSPEVCNRVDDDCDGEVDEDFPRLGSDCSAGQGVCAATGLFICGEEGTEVCSADPTPGQLELCGNSLDDDCDGETDEGFDTLGDACSAGVGACASQGTLGCSTDGLALECDAAAGTPGTELCGNGIDDDCDGETDEGFDTVGDACSVGEGVCAATGTIVCTSDAVATECDATAGTPGAELCGNGLDDDCDGQADEGFELAGMPCSNGTGACQATGTYQCTGDLSDVSCDATPGTPETEICGNATDDDCDGSVDEGFTDLGNSCQTTLDQCTETGTIVCAGTTTTCDAVITPVAETCDGTDQNCNGDIDDGDICGICADDSFEVNDSQTSAATLPSGVRHELVSCFTDPDWFALPNVNAGETIIINSTFVDLTADLDLRLLDPSGATVAASISSTNDEQIVHSATSAGTYLVEARQLGPKASQPYTLYWETGPAPTCADDPWERNDTIATAAPLPLDRVIDAEICADTVDYYDLGYVTRGFGITITLDHVNANGDLDMRLFRYGSQIDSAQTLSDTETIVLWPEFGGEYVLVVEGASASVANDYSLTTTFAGPFTCETSGADVSFEPDNGPASTTTQAAEDGRTAAICADDDWIRLPGISANDIVVASLFFEHDIGDLDFSIYPDLGPTGSYNSTTALANAITVTDDEHVRFTAPTTGDYIAEIRGFGGDNGRYRFVWNTVTYACDDAFEPNNRFSSFPSLAFETSTRLEPSTMYNGTLCTGDLDNFELGVFGTGQTITATVTADVGGFEIELYNGLTSVALDDTAGMTKVVTWTTAADDDHTLAIRPLAGSNVNYSVSYEVN